jgi:hypothetical protein
MNNRELLEGLSKDRLIDLIGIYAKNWLATDGVWFQAVERTFGMDEAMRCDEEAWRRFAPIEAARIKEFLGLPERAGLDGLMLALQYRFYGGINEYELLYEGGEPILRNVDCRVQTARKRKGMPFHPCKSVGIVEYTQFAKAIDDRIRCRCVSCFPEITDESACCGWAFTCGEF